MKRLIIVVLLLAFTIGICVYENNVIYNYYDEAEVCIKKMKEQYEDQEFKSASETALQLEKLWKDAEERLFYVTNSSSLDELGTTIAKLPLLAIEQSDEFLSESRVAEVMLKHLVDRKRYYIY